MREDRNDDKGPAALRALCGLEAALDAFTKGFALEVASEGIRVNAVRPGLIDTEIHGRAGMPDRIEKVGPRIPIGRVGTADEVAHAIPLARLGRGFLRDRRHS